MIDPWEEATIPGWAMGLTLVIALALAAAAIL